ncbi:MAG: hypothetical protein MZV64_10635 [Ignavibacteriales bacterium]|nr:hypothetical protein [Ignavibacteriales bacterium]
MAGQLAASARAQLGLLRARPAGSSGRPRRRPLSDKNAQTSARFLSSSTTTRDLGRAHDAPLYIFSILRFNDGPFHPDNRTTESIIISALRLRSGHGSRSEHLQGFLSSHPGSRRPARAHPPEEIPRRRQRARRAHQPRERGRPQAQGRDRARVRKREERPRRVPGHGPRLRGAAGRPAQRGPGPHAEGPQVPGRDRIPGQVHGRRDPAGQRDPGAARGAADEDLERAAFLKNDLQERFGIVAEVMEDGAQGALSGPRRGAGEAAQDQGPAGHRVGRRQPRPAGRRTGRSRRAGRDGRRREQGRDRDPAHPGAHRRSRGRRARGAARRSEALGLRRGRRGRRRARTLARIRAGADARTSARGPARDRAGSGRSADRGGGRRPRREIPPR